ncbi:MAG: hypothetical protein HGA97_10735 [Chlorobiaceae bacterium]|nr:hypothetical protein [Chlorobiaceae bacterium]
MPSMAACGRNDSGALMRMRAPLRISAFPRANTGHRSPCVPMVASTITGRTCLCCLGETKAQDLYSRKTGHDVVSNLFRIAGASEDGANDSR